MEENSYVAVSFTDTLYNGYMEGMTFCKRLKKCRVLIHATAQGSICSVEHAIIYTLCWIEEFRRPGFAQ
jgi:hypothetical protein